MLDQKGVQFKLTNITKMFVRISNSMKKKRDYLFLLYKGVSSLALLTVLVLISFSGGCPIHWGFPRGSVVKNPLANARAFGRYMFISWVGKVPWRKKWQPTPVFLPG